jgi:hypothetical protein
MSLMVGGRQVGVIHLMGSRGHPRILTCESTTWPIPTQALRSRVADIEDAATARQMPLEECVAAVGTASLTPAATARLPIGSASPTLP